MERLFIRLPDFEWRLFKDGREIASGLGRDDLPKATGDVIALAPGEEVLLTQVTISAAQRRHLGKVLPYIAEEQLAEEVSQMSLSLGPQRGEDAFALAAVRHEALARWLAALDDAGVTPDALLPDMLALPWTPERWTLAAEGNRFRLRTGPASGMATETDMLPVCIEALLDAHPGDIEVDCYGLTENIKNVLARFSRLTLHAMEAGVWEKMPPEPWPVNLLPPERRNIQARSLWQLLGRNLAKVACLWFAAQLAVDAGSAYYLDRKADEARAETAQLYRQVFPDETPPSDPVGQMKARLSGVNGNDRHDFLNLLGRIALLWPEAGAPVMKHIEYAGDTRALTLQLESATLEPVNALAGRAGDAGLHAAIGAVSSDKNGVQAQLAVRGTAP